MFSPFPGSAARFSPPRSARALTTAIPWVVAGLLAALLVVGAAPSTSAAEAPARAAPAAGTEDEENRAARQWYIDTYVDLAGAAWAREDVYADPALAAFWDDKQAGIIAAQVAKAEAAGFEVHIGLIPAPAAKNRNGEFQDVHVGIDVRQEIALGDAEARGVDSAVYVIWDGRNTFSLALDEGGLVREMEYRSPVGINDQVPGPAIHHELRTTLDRRESLDPTDVEAVPSVWLSGHPSSADATTERNRPVDLGWVVLIVVVSALLGFAYYCLRASDGVLGKLRRRRGAQAREDDAQWRMQMSRIRDRASSAYLRLEGREPLSQPIGDAADRLPYPLDTTNPLIWAAWLALYDEAQGRERSRCFFRPDLPAHSQRSWTGLGGDFEVPVSKHVAQQLDEGEDPDYLSSAGLNRGKPYWRDSRSPFAATGFGAFGPMSAAITAMPADWHPGPGPELSGDALGGPARTAAKVGRTPKAGRAAQAGSAVPLGRPRWYDVVVVGVLIPGLLIAGASALSWHNHHERAELVSAAHLPAEAVAGDVETTRLDAIVAEVEDDGVYIDPAMRTLFSPDDEHRYSTTLDDLALDVVVIGLTLRSSDEFRGDRSLFLHELYQRIPEDTVLITVDEHSTDVESATMRPADWNEESNLWERTIDLPPHRAVSEVQAALPDLGLEPERSRSAEVFAPVDSDRVIAGPVPGTPGYFRELRVTILMTAVVGYLAFAALFLTVFSMFTATRKRLS